MQTDDLWELIRKLEADRDAQGPGTGMMVPTAGVGGGNSSLASDVQKLATTIPRSESPESTAVPRESGNSAGGGDSTATTVLKTIGMVTGVGPLVTGLVKLFGSDNSPEETPALTPYSLPPPVSVEGGVAQDRTFVPVSYSQSGTARGPSPNAAPSGQGTQIHVNVQAMDSRSFLDHSDEIARAVREAMLRSHSLNDVVSEL